jgi:hypothetical protein
MYHILAAKRHRQDGAREGKNQALRLAATYAPRLVKGAVAVLACIGGVNEQVNLAGTGRHLNLLRSIDQRPAARFQAKAVERLLAEGGFDLLAEIGWNLDVIRLEGAGEGALELALGIGFVERLAADADPRAAARSAGADIGCDLSVGAKGEPDQLLARRRPPREDAGALCYMRI